MEPTLTRELSAMRSVLKDPNASGPNPVYQVFKLTDKDNWVNQTVISPGKIGDEYPKTFGHYHPKNAPHEIYHIANGEGILLLQKKHLEVVDEVLLIRAKPGDEIVIKNEYGHSWSNIGNTPLISYDNWTLGHTPQDYKPIEKLHGMAYYLVEENGQPKIVPNPNYKNLPQPIWITATNVHKGGETNVQTSQ